jgi:S-adenosyl-L-methionine hydrolase (adenosine-forming)
MRAKPNTIKGPRPVVTLSSDFGLADAYVAAMKAAILREAPQARLVDISHLIPPHDILYGSFILERAIDAFEAGTIHLAVVDPGVGTRRKILAVEIHGQIVICPDNGLITWSWRKWKGGKARELTWRPKQISGTFHGRDIMAPATGMLAGGKAIEDLARRKASPVLLDVSPATASAKVGKIIYIDRFGNAITNIPANAVVDRRREVHVGESNLGRIRKTYGDVEAGALLALVGSAGLLEIAVRDGSAARDLRLRVGDEVWLEVTA